MMFFAKKNFFFSSSGFEPAYPPYMRDLGRLHTNKLIPLVCEALVTSKGISKLIIRLTCRSESVLGLTRLRQHVSGKAHASTTQKTSQHPAASSTHQNVRGTCRCNTEQVSKALRKELGLVAAKTERVQR